MPVALLRSYTRMLPRLRAGGALQGVAVTMIGSGAMEKRHAESTLSEWKRDARGGEPPEARELTHAERMDLYVANDFFEVEEVPV